jgi:hypothetical protein
MVGRTALELNRHVEELKLLQEAPRHVAIVYSDTAAIHDLEYAKSAQAVYEELVFMGVSPSFVSEKQILAGKLNDYETVVLPSTHYLHDKVAIELERFAQNGKLICVGKLPKFDQYIRPLDISLTGYASQLNTIKVNQELTSNIQSKNGIWWRAVHDGNDWIVFAANLHDLPFDAVFECQGQTVKKTLEPRVPVLLRITLK